MNLWRAKGWVGRLVFDDWRQIGKAGSIYSTPLGVDLSTGQLHRGTTFQATILIEMGDDTANDIKEAYSKHKAYPVFAIMPVEREEGE